MKATLIKFFAFSMLYSLAPFAFSQIPVDCYPVCSESQIASAKRYLKTEISFLAKKYQNYESKLNLLKNDISSVRFNQRRGQKGSVVKSTSTLGERSDFNSEDSSAELRFLSEKLEKLQDSIFELGKEEGKLSAYLDDFAILVPKAAQKAQSKRSLTKNPYSDTPDRSLGDVDFYYNDDDELVLNVGNFYGLFIGVNEYENEEIVDLAEPVEDAK